MAKATPELMELNGIKGPPLDLLRKVLDTLGAKYEVPKAEEGDTVVRKIYGIYLEPFLEPNSVVFYQYGLGRALITAIEQLTKVKCIAFRTQLNIEGKLITKSDLVNDPGTFGDKICGRILVRAKERDLYLLFESKPGFEIGQCSASMIIPNCLTKDGPMEQTLDIYLSYEGSPWSPEFTGKISVWHWE